MLGSMRFSALLLLSLAAVSPVVGLSGCKLRNDPTPAPAVAEPVKPATGWTAEVTSAATTTIVDALASDGWVSRFRESNGRMPVIAVASFEDRSNDYVPVDEVAAEFIRVLGTSDRVLAASAGQVADVTLAGVIGVRQAADGAKEFTIDARLSDGKTSEVLWVAGITRPYPGPVAVPVTTAPAAAASHR